MSLDNLQNTKTTLTTVVGIFFACLLSKSIVDGRSLKKLEPTQDFVHTPDTLISDTSNRLPHSLLNSNEDLLPTNDPRSKIYINFANDDHHQISELKPTFKASSTTVAGSNSEIVKPLRSKRSPYPPGFVTWTWREPCVCPPGQFFSCRCYYSNNSSDEKKLRKRRSRNKKLKFRS